MTFNEAPSRPRPSDTIAPASLSSLDDAIFKSEERITALRQWLVQPTQPIIHDAAVCWTYIKTAILENPPSADNEAAKQQLKEAADIYYSNNHFIVRLELLDNFLHDTNGTVDIPGLAVGLIRDLTVVITADDLKKKSEKECEGMVKQLRYLFGCTELKRLVIEIHGGGDIAGTDWPTQEIIRIIAPVVKDLIVQFGRWLSISKVGPDGASRNITSYWSLATETARSAFDSCTATSDQIMRVQTNHWANPRRRSLLG